MRAMALALFVATTAVAADAGTFRASLAGTSEVGGQGDTDGAGVAFVAIDGTEVSYYIWVKGIDAPTAAHIHVGRATESGAVVVSFAPAFGNAASGVYVAAGSVTADAAVTAAIADDPAAYYVNVHNAAFTGGAVRGQLLGGGAAGSTVAASLNGSREVGAAGDGDGSGFAGVVIDGATVYYYLRVHDIAAPTSAHIHRGRAGEQGQAVVSFVVDPVLIDGVIAGSIATSPELAMEILRDPASFYVNVHNADFPGGALRGQLGRTETALHFPVAARNKGAGTSLFKTDVRIMSFSDTDEVVWAEWYPKNTAGLAGPALTTRVVVAAGGEAVLDDAPGVLFGATDRGAIRLISMSPFVAVGRTYNDQRGAGLGTFGQFTEGLPIERAARSGGLLLGSSRPKADLVDFRTNLGYFNPNPIPVAITFRVAKPDGTPVGSPTTRTIAPYANDLLLYYQILTGIPAAERNQANFVITYAADSPVFVFSSVVDNLTDDGLHQPALPVPMPATTPVPNQPPDASITSPAGDVTIAPGESVTFAGTASDPDGDDVSVVWDFGDGTTSTELSPGDHTFADAGTYAVTLTATDDRDLSDPTPASVTVTVRTNAAPDGTIVAPAGSVTTTVGTAVMFEGTASDPDGDGVSVVWDFGDGVSSTEAATSHSYLTPGVYTATFTATDALGLGDPTPPTVSVTVNAVVTVTLSQLQEEIFTPICSGCHPPNGGMDLRAGHTFASVVNVNSTEVVSMKRVKPGDPDNSYIVRKLNGGPGITGSRMPQGGPFLTPAEIQRVRDWITAGAQDN